MSPIKKPASSSDKSTGSEVPVLAISSFEEDLASLRWILRDSQWTLYEGRNCQQGLLVLRDHLIPIIIVDKDAPGGGWKKIRHEIHHYVPVPKLIVTYRFSESHSVIEVLRHGAYYVLAKPFDRSELFQGIGFAWLQWTRECKRVKGRDVARASGGF